MEGGVAYIYIYIYLSGYVVNSRDFLIMVMKKTYLTAAQFPGRRRKKTSKSPAPEQSLPDLKFSPKVKGLGLFSEGLGFRVTVFVKWAVLKIVGAFGYCLYDGT